ncbi:hypothetical protein scyTo_0022025 [Scyliorhinus torazame]|uniref:Uncharacterized protein n=1 Tax=Scyliorhinus torazame TaxID=75743 RepID=A0A401QB11_SCYTO|nr:hypothetical protein [Scyliorhinus torazame]
MESLMENPMRAVLYLKELTTIVQNQQTLILTQRHRIHELELKVEELLQENQSLKDEPGESGHRQQQQRELPEPETEPELQPDPDSHRHKHQHHPQHKAQAISNSRAAIHCHPALHGVLDTL